jgi:hypothetical protein
MGLKLREYIYENLFCVPLFRLVPSLREFRSIVLQKKKAVDHG